MHALDGQPTNSKTVGGNPVRVRIPPSAPLSDFSCSGADFASDCRRLQTICKRVVCMASRATSGAQAWTWSPVLPSPSRSDRIRQQAPHLAYRCSPGLRGSHLPSHSQIRRPEPSWRRSPATRRHAEGLNSAGCARACTGTSGPALDMGWR